MFYMVCIRDYLSVYFRNLTLIWSPLKYYYQQIGHFPFDVWHCSSLVIYRITAVLKILTYITLSQLFLAAILEMMYVATFKTTLILYISQGYFVHTNKISVWSSGIWIPIKRIIWWPVGKAFMMFTSQNNISTKKH